MVVSSEVKWPRMRFTLTRHAREEMERRAIPEDTVKEVLERPQQIAPGYGGKKVYQSKVNLGGGAVFLVRVIVAAETDPAVVVTVYKTGKIEKYWRSQ